jgi:SAM-dependent methyltransferase
LAGNNHAQQNRKSDPYKCGFVIKSFRKLQEDYQTYAVPLGCSKYEVIADIGTMNGRIPVMISVFIDSITWYLQDIDRACLNRTEFDHVMAYHTKLKKGAITGEFELVIGQIDKTNLPDSLFDRVLMVNVYHELELREPILTDIKRLLKADGKLVIMEKMGLQRNEIHGDCKLPKLFEPDFISEMNDFGYLLEKKFIGEQVSNLTFYTFYILHD